MEKQRGSFSSIESLESRTLLAATLPAGFHLSTVVSGFAEPTAEVVTPDGRVFIAEKQGEVRVVQNGVMRRKPLLSVNVDTFSERGLDGIVLDPNFATNGFIYVYYTKADPSKPNVRNNQAMNRLSRFTVDPERPNRVLPNSEVVLLDNIPSTEGNHNGGSMQFGADGMLYLGVGDAGVSSNGQKLLTLNGKVLRLNVEDPGNIIPPDNPFVGHPKALPEIWAYGFRNPFTSAVLPGTNTIYVNDVGSSGLPVTEEVDQLVKGGNFGWDIGEGRLHKHGLIDPVYSYAHPNQPGAITGGVFYTGTQFPASFDGQYLLSDFIMGFIRQVNPSTHGESGFATGLDKPIDLDMAPDGSLLVLSLDGVLFRLTYTPPRS